MCFFSKKLKSEDVFMCFGRTIPYMEVAGCNSKEYPGIWKITYTIDRKDEAIYMIKSTYKKWVLKFEYKFNREVQFVKVEISINNLLLGDSNCGENELSKEIEKKFPKLKFIFLETETKIVFSPRVCKTMDDVKNVLECVRNTWNESGFLAFINENFEPSEDCKDK